MMRALFKKFWSFSFFLGILGSSTTVFSEDYLCYIPGAGGLYPYTSDVIQPELLKRDIPFVIFDTGEIGTIKQKAERVLAEWERLLDRDPQAHCHLFGFSMGGVIGRYLSHHMEFSDRKVVKERLLSFTTASTPHRGTPLANFLRRYSPGMFPDLEELDAKGLEKYNNPKYKETYSPEIEGIPNLSYVTYVNSVDDTNGSLGRVGYQYIVKKIQQDNRLNNQSRSIQNDGIVPRDSQAFGRVIWEREVNHSFFHMETEGSDQYSPMDFFEEHWEMLMDYEEPTIMSIMGLN